MKRTLTILLLLCMVCMSGWAQKMGESNTFFSAEKSSGQVKFGLRGGINLSTLVYLLDDGARTMDARHIGFNAGIEMDVPILKSLGFQSGLYFVQKGLKENTDGFSYGERQKTVGTPCYLEIPLLACYRHDFGGKLQLQVKTGLYVAYGVCGKLKVKEYDSHGIKTRETEVDWFGDESDANTAAFRRIDMGWHLGAGLKIKDCLYLGYAFEAGFLDISRTETYKGVKTRSHWVDIGFNF